MQVVKMICNRDRIQNGLSDVNEPDSDVRCQGKCCVDDLSAKKDIQDILTDLHAAGRGEVTDFSSCDNDISLVEDEEALWQALIGEIKTPLGVLPSVNQNKYGCQIWDLMGDKIDDLFEETFRFYILKMCQQYPEIISVPVIGIRYGDKGSLALEMTVNSIYGDFTGKERLAWSGSF